MRYIRRKDDPLKVKSFGHVDIGGLGEFDPEIYEEVEGELPEEWEKETTFTESREAEYNNRGVTIEAMVIALWEHVIENRPQATQNLQAIRTQVKNDIPKPHS
jgi:hypothetical protein